MEPNMEIKLIKYLKGFGWKRKITHQKGTGEKLHKFTNGFDTYNVLMIPYRIGTKQVIDWYISTANIDAFDTVMKKFLKSENKK